MKTANEILFEHGIDTMSLNDDFNSQLFHAMERYAEQKISDSDGWISVEDGLPEVSEIVKVKHTHSEKEAIAWVDIDGEWNSIDSIGRAYFFNDVFNYGMEEKPITQWKSASLKPNKLSDSKVVWKDAELSPNVKVIISSLPFPTSIEEYETVIANLIEAIPLQTNDRDWWPDSLTDAVNEANKLLENKKPE